MTLVTWVPKLNRERIMSTKNIVSTTKLASGRELVKFRVDDAEGKPQFSGPIAIPREREPKFERAGTHGISKELR